MAEEFVRARCTTTGAIASLPARAVDRGHIKNWVRADGPTPSRNKPAVRRRTAATEESSADGESANTEKE